jgi:hypothetical protein
MICCSVNSNLRAMLLLWKNNIVDFSVNVQEIIDLGNQGDCLLVTNNNDNECEVEQLAKRCWSNNDSDKSIKRNYETAIGVIGLMCPDTLFEGIYNYLRTIEDDELLK